MHKVNIMNLIERFKKADNRTIWQLLDKLATEPDVFSTHPKQLTPYFEGDTYVYIHDMDMVIVYLDKHIDGQSVLADEEKFNGESPLYFTESSHWISPVYLLLLASHGIRQVLRRLDMKEPTIQCVCLTNTYIINKEDMFEVWDWLDVTMIDMVNVRRDAQVSDNTETSGGLLFMNYMTHKGMTKWELDPKYDHVVENNPIALKNESSPKNEEEETCELEDDIDINIPDVGNLHGVQILKPIRHPDRLLNQLIGLEDVKKRISDITMFTQYNHRLRALGGKAHHISLHSVFYGNPGTGKTTIGRIYSSLLFKAGVLSKGHVVLVNGRQAFVGRHFGDEESSVEKLIDLARGGQLFIDEAYTLAGNHHEDPGYLILPLLMQIMADEKYRDISIVIAGYQKPLEELLATNPGLDSRFPYANRILFPDYSPNELFEIAMKRMEEFDYSVSQEFQYKLKEIIAEDYAHRSPSFGNARYVTAMMEEIYIKHGIRCIKEDIKDAKELHNITLDDIFILEQKKKNFVIREKRKIGF